MSWRDELVPATLGGVPIQVRATNRRGGRRGTLREFFGRDTPFKDDTGRKARAITVTAICIGDDYLEHRDALVDVLEGGGTMEFVSPWRFAADVRLIGEFDLRETVDEGGYAEFSIPLVESGEDVIVVAPDTGARLRDAANVVETSVSGDVGRNLNVGDLVGNALNRVRQTIQDATTQMVKAQGAIAGKMNLISNIANSIAQFQRVMNELLATPRQLFEQFRQLGLLLSSLISPATERGIPLQTPSTGADFEGVGGVHAAVAATSARAIRREGTTPPSDAERVQAAIGLARTMQAVSAADAVTGSTEERSASAPTPTRAQEKASRYALQDMARTVGVTAACRLVSELQFESSAQAQSVLVELGDMIEAIAAEASDESYVALTNLRAALTAHVRAVSEALPRVAYYTPPGSAPALVVAHRVYGDATRDLEIVARNRIRHPLFVLPDPIEVLR